MQRITSFEREALETMVRRGKKSIRAMARALGRDHTVIVRELARNTGDYLSYTAHTATAATVRRQQRKKKSKLEKYPALSL